MSRIEAQGAKYIKLGAEGAWERLCIEDGILHLGYADVPHELALASDKEGIRRIYLDRGLAPRVATSHANQVLDFYHAGTETLWITFSDGFLWWCFARPGVEYRGAGEGDASGGVRLRHTVDGWRNTSMSGRPLRISELNGRLTKVAAFRGTICKVEALDYLLRKINDDDLPEVTSARVAKGAILDSTQALMKLLPWADFELLVDLVFAQSGWRRVGQTGGSQKTVDIDLVLPSTGERAFVQVKSQTNQGQLDDYAGRLTGRDDARMFYVYHSGPKELTCPEPRVVLVGPERLAELVLSAGLFDWLLDKTG